MADREMQTADAQARITLSAAFAESTVIVEAVSPSEVRVRKVGEEETPMVPKTTTSPNDRNPPSDPARPRLSRYRPMTSALRSAAYLRARTTAA